MLSFLNLKSIATKGQLISKGLYVVIVSTKKTTKKSSNQKTLLYKYGK